MKPPPNTPGIPFNFEAIPLWLKPDLWDETKTIRRRGLLFVLLCTLSTAVLGLFVFVPIGIYKGIHMAGTTAFIWLTLSLIVGPPIGLAVWWDFVRASNKLAAEAKTVPEVEKPSSAPEDRTD